MKILIAVLCIIGFIATFDFLTFTVKSAPKSSNFPKVYWYVGFICDGVLIYLYLNNWTF